MKNPVISHCLVKVILRLFCVRTCNFVCETIIYNNSLTHCFPNALERPGGDIFCPQVSFLSGKKCSQNPVLKVHLSLMLTFSRLPNRNVVSLEHKRRPTSQEVEVVFLLREAMG